jgi:hypothetical protein
VNAASHLIKNSNAHSVVETAKNYHFLIELSRTKLVNSGKTKHMKTLKWTALRGKSLSVPIVGVTFLILSTLMVFAGYAMILFYPNPIGVCRFREIMRCTQNIVLG